MLRKLRKNKKGFTLIELIMIIVILGILAVFAIPKYYDLTEKAEKKTVRAITGQLVAAAHTSFAKSAVTSTVGRGSYPANATDLIAAADVSGVSLSASGATSITGVINNVTYTWTYSFANPSTDGGTGGTATVTDNAG